MAAGDDSSVPLGTPTGNADSRLTANGDQRQVVAVGNAGDVVAGVEPFGSIDVHIGNRTVFYDSWSTSLDTTDKWTVASGAAPTVSGGNMTMPATASTTNVLRTKDTTRANAGFAYVANGLMLEAGTATGAGRFWGLGTAATTPAPAVLAQEGVGFEIDQATGALLAVTYTGGTRTTIATLTKPVDGLSHRYALYFRVTAAYWYIDSLQVPVASVTWPSVAVVELPALLVRQNAATFGGTPVFINHAHLTADTAPSGQVLMDPVVGSRQARVTAAGALSTDVGAGVRPDAYLNVRHDPTTLLFDTFEAIDTTNTWTVSGTAVPTGAAGVLSVNPGTAANATSVARSQPAFIPGSSAYLQAGLLVTLQAATITGNTRWFGLAVPSASPTTTAPVTDGAVFEVRAADGLLYGSSYAGGALSQSVALTRPTDGAVHRYQITYKASRVYFNIDNVEVGSIAFPNPTIAALPLSIGSINGGAVMGTAATMTSTLMGVADTGFNQFKIADGTYPWRRASVSAAGALAVQGTAGGTAVPVSGAFFQATQPVSGTVALAAGAAAVGTVGVTALPALAAGANAIGTVGVTALPALPAGANAIGTVGVTALPALPAGTNAIGTVTTNPAPALTVGTASGNIFTGRVVATAVTTGAVLVAAPAAGLALYITDFNVSNSGTALTVVSLLPAAGTALIDLVAAASGGGGTVNLRTPIRITTATALHYAMTVASTSVYINVTGYIAA